MLMYSLTTVLVPDPKIHTKDHTTFWSEAQHLVGQCSQDGKSICPVVTMPCLQCHIVNNHTIGCTMDTTTGIQKLNKKQKTKLQCQSADRF